MQYLSDNQENNETIKLTIDNKEVEVPKGTTINKAAKMLGIDIPTLCYMELKDMNIENKPGGCRLCVVEVQETTQSCSLLFYKL